MAEKRLHNKPADVDAEAGQVLIDSPGGSVTAMTPEAATETARRLTHTALEAAHQRQEAGESRN